MKLKSKVREYQLPSYDKIEGVFLDERETFAGPCYALMNVSMEELHRIIHEEAEVTGQTPGKPRYYAVTDAKKIFFQPTPDKPYHVDVVLWHRTVF